MPCLACFDQRINGSKTLPTPIRFVYIRGSSPHTVVCCSSLGVVKQAGLEPAASAYDYAATLPSELLSHNAPGDPGAARLSGLPLGEKSFGNWLIAMEGGAGFEPAASTCAHGVLSCKHLPPICAAPPRLRDGAAMKLFRGGGGRTRLLMVKGPISPPKEDVRNGFPDPGGMPRLCHAAQRRRRWCIAFNRPYPSGQWHRYTGSQTDRLCFPGSR